MSDRAGVDGQYDRVGYACFSALKKFCELRGAGNICGRCIRGLHTGGVGGVYDLQPRSHRDCNDHDQYSPLLVRKGPESLHSRSVWPVPFPSGG